MVSVTVGSVLFVAVNVTGVVPGEVPAGGVTQARTGISFVPLGSVGPVGVALAVTSINVIAAEAQVAVPDVLSTNFTVYPGGTVAVRLNLVVVLGSSFVT
jgi:hypothetical protein